MSYIIIIIIIITWRYSQTTGLGVMISRGSNTRDLVVILQMLAVLSSGIQTMSLVTTQTRDANTKYGLRKTTNKRLICILGATLHKENKKRITRIRNECARFQTTNQNLADKVKTIIKSGWFSELEIQEMRQKINRESRQDTNTITDTSNTEKQAHSNRNEPQTNNRNATHTNQQEQTLTQEEKMNLENLKITMYEQKTRLLSLLKPD